MIFKSHLDTPRLTVRPFREEDVDRLVELFADPAVHRFVDDGKAMPRAHGELWVANSQANLAKHGFGTGAVIEKETGRLIGWAGVARPPDEAPEIIYGLEEAAWRKGYGSELLRALVTFARERNIDPVRATVAADNEGSIAILLAKGFILADAALGGSCDTHLYELSSPQA